MTTGKSYEELIQPLADPAFQRQHLEISVLRTDWLHPVVSGNKWMKLQPWIKKAKETHTHHIISKGGPWSNHLHAAAYTCLNEGFQFTAIVKASPGFMTATLHDLQQWKANIIYTDHAQYTDEHYWENLAFVQDALYIPMGGEGETAVKGVTAFFDHYAGRSFDYVICPVGTGTTLLGIAYSKLNYHSLLGMDPGIKDPHYQQLANHLNTHFPAKNFEILYNAGLKKFGKWPEDLPSKMNAWYQRWNLPTDVMYTAKMFAQLEHLVTRDYFKEFASILLIHTGGLQGNRSLPGNELTF